MSKPTVAITAPGFCYHSPDILRALEEKFNLKILKNLPIKASESELIDALKDCDGIVLGLHNLTKTVLFSLSSLKIVSRFGIGYENVDVKAATEKGIIITYTRGIQEEISVAEHTIALMLAAAKNLISSHIFSTSGEWQKNPSKRLSFSGKELYNKVLGVIGLGHIGQYVAKIARYGLNMQVIAYDPYIADEVFSKLGVVRIKDLDELLCNSDVITLHTPLTKETFNLISKEKFNKMKKDVIIINTARGQLLDEKALFDFLKDNPNACAASDVFSEEPPSKDNPLLTLPNFILTPHVAAFTRDAIRRMDETIFEDLTNFLINKRLPPKERTVNPEVFSML
ncbi:MAG: hydroxyacid dehydrogenase [Nitrososphaeria archaeon]